MIKSNRIFSAMLVVLLVLAMAAVLLPTGGAKAGICDDDFLVSVASRQDNNYTTNLGSITLAGTTYFPLPQQFCKPYNDYSVEYTPATGYVFDSWEVSGGIVIFDANANPTGCYVEGDGMLMAVYRSSQQVVSPASPASPPGPRVSPTVQRPLLGANMGTFGLTLSTQAAAPNQPVTIATNVVNTGDEAGNYSIALKINGQLEEARMVSVGPQGTQPVKFTVTRSEPGTYNVNIGGQQGSFTVVGREGTAHAPLNAGLITIVIMAVLVLATSVVLALTFH